MYIHIYIHIYIRRTSISGPARMANANKMASHLLGLWKVAPERLRLKGLEFRVLGLDGDFKSLWDFLRLGPWQLSCFAASSKSRFRVLVALSKPGGLGATSCDSRASGRGQPGNPFLSTPCAHIRCALWRLLCRVLQVLEGLP